MDPPIIFGDFTGASFSEYAFEVFTIVEFTTSVCIVQVFQFCHFLQQRYIQKIRQECGKILCNIGKPFIEFHLKSLNSPFRWYMNSDG